MTRAVVGFDRAVKIEWMELAAGIASSGVSKAQAAAQMKALLGDELRGEYAVRKTSLVLTRMWFPEDTPRIELRNRAIELLPVASSGERLAIYWGLALATYGFFRNAAASVGRLGRLQPTISRRQVVRKLVDVYGDRQTVRRAGERVVQTMVDWGVLERVGGQGYVLASPRELSGIEMQRWLVEALMIASDQGSLPLDAITYLPEMFPFVMANEPVQIANDPRFRVTAFADRRLMLYLASAS